MSVENGKVCCNCRHNIRTKDKTDQYYIVNHCDIDGHYIGYIECMEGWCRRWAKEREATDLRNKESKQQNDEKTELICSV